MLSSEKCETEEVRVATVQSEVGSNQVKPGFRIGCRNFPLTPVTEKESLKIADDRGLFCGVTGFVSFWLQYLLLAELTF
jgi:hypothetical protein